MFLKSIFLILPVLLTGCFDDIGEKYEPDEKIFYMSFSKYDQNIKGGCKELLASDPSRDKIFTSYAEARAKESMEKLKIIKEDEDKVIWIDNLHQGLFNSKIDCIRYREIQNKDFIDFGKMQ